MVLHLSCFEKKEKRDNTFSSSLSSYSASFNHSPTLLSSESGEQIAGRRHGLCWQGCGGISWAVVPVRGEQAGSLAGRPC